MQGIVQGGLSHGDTFAAIREYAHGDVFETEDAKLFERLRRSGALKLTSEALPAEVTEAKVTQLEAEKADLQAQIAALLAAQTAAPAPETAADVNPLTGEPDPNE